MILGGLVGLITFDGFQNIFLFGIMILAGFWTTRKDLKLCT